MLFTILASAITSSVFIMSRVVDPLLSFQRHIGVMSLCDSTMPLLPVKKILSVVWRSAHSRQSRMPSTVLDCLDDPPPRSGVRAWLVVIISLTLTYYLYHTSSIGIFSFLNKDVEDIEVVRTAGPASTCGRGCNLEEFTNKTDINITAIPILDVNEPIPSEMCEINMVGRGKITPNRIIKVNDSGLEPRVRVGGYYRPSSCQSRHKLAVIVPYRNREKNLAVFLFNIHPFLINQNLEYRLFVIEQSGDQKFNKGRLFNAGFEQVTRFSNWTCLVFHDVDLLPLDERILYTCPTFPRHMSTTVVEFMKIPDYNAHFGGVTAMTTEHFLKVNGYSNKYWGWGGEDFDMFWRHALLNAGFRESRYKKEGLSTLVYKVLSIRLRTLYTHIVVNINPDKELTE